MERGLHAGDQGHHSRASLWAGGRHAPIMRCRSPRTSPVVEDAAQAIGARRDGRAAGSFGDIGCFSFSPARTSARLATPAWSRPTMTQLARGCALSAITGRAEVLPQVVGGNFRLDALQAAVLRVKAPHLAAWTDGRRRNAARYRELMDARDSAHPSRLPVEPSAAFHIYNQFVMRVQRRDALRAPVSRGVETDIYYPVPLHLQECFAPLGYRRGQIPARRSGRERVARAAHLQRASRGSAAARR